MKRLFQHLLHTPLHTRRAFPPPARERLRDAIATSERQHRGEIRLVVEGDWPLSAVLTGRTCRERALDVFGLTRVWDTEENTGILIYVLLCEHRVELLADRGIHQQVSPEEWQAACRQLEQDFAKGDFEAGCQRAITDLTTLLARHFPVQGRNPNELPDAPIVWR